VNASWSGVGGCKEIPVSPNGPSERILDKASTNMGLVPKIPTVQVCLTEHAPRLQIRVSRMGSCQHELRNRDVPQIYACTSND